MTPGFCSDISSRGCWQHLHPFGATTSFVIHHFPSWDKTERMFWREDDESQLCPLSKNWGSADRLAQAGLTWTTPPGPSPGRFDPKSWKTQTQLKSDFHLTQIICSHIFTWWMFDEWEHDSLTNRNYNWGQRFNRKRLEISAFVWPHPGRRITTSYTYH